MLTPPVSSAERVKVIQDIIQDTLANQSQMSAEVMSLLKNLQDMAESDQRRIVRGLDLKPHQMMAGLLLLHYAARLIEQKLSGSAVKCTVEQEGSHVKIIIETPEETSAACAQVLEKYSLVLLGRLPLDKLATDEKQLMELKQTLDLSVLTLNINNVLHHQPTDDITGTTPDLADMVAKLHMAVGYGISTIQELQQVIGQLLNREQESIAGSLKVLRTRLHYTMNEADEAAVKQALLTVKEQEPDAFEEIRKVINNSSTSGAAGDVIYSWLSSLSRIMPG